MYIKTIFSFFHQYDEHPAEDMLLNQHEMPNCSICRPRKELGWWWIPVYYNRICGRYIENNTKMMFNSTT